MNPIHAWRRVVAIVLFGGAIVGIGAGISAEPPTGRLPVLKQIDEPHPYYYREMYLPQVTSGPSAAAWSPDGTELVYAMQGTLWRQKLGAGEAVQLTDGPGYDSEPDWSPDGRYILYTSYRNDSLELWVLDLQAGGTRALVANGAVNLDARWSPDGKRVAYVSTAFHGHWHVFVAEVADGKPTGAVPQKITEEKDSGLPRYYYSKFDQYLSPTWSPDGKELILVSNRGDVWGSGNLWRMNVEPGSEMRLVRKEETNWKAHPDWARDGHRVVYSSYLGRQRNQLWLTTAEGGDPFELTYCECDHTRPRWSPDGRRIAFVTNEGGNVSLRVLSIPGGAVEAVVPATRRYLHPQGTLTVSVTDAAGAPSPVRLSVTGADGRGWAPDDAWRHADDGFDRKVRPFEMTYFHAKGSATLTLPAGRYTVLATHGLEYAPVTKTVEVSAGATATASLRLERLMDLPALGWWSGDMHVHMNYGGAYVNDPARLRAQAEAEDLHVVEDLIVNKEQRIPDMGRFSPDLDPVSTPTTLVKHDEEYHTSWWGHTGHLGLKEHLILPIYAGYANTAAWSLFPDNSTIIDLAHAQGGISGYVHPLDPPEPDPAGRRPAHVRAAGGRRARQGGLRRSRRVQRSPDDGRGLVPAPERGLSPPHRVGNGRDGELRVAARPGRHESGVRPLGRKARLPRLARRDQGGPDVRDERPAARVHARRARRGRRDRAAGGRPDAHGKGEPALDRSGREARDRLERRRRRDREARVGRDPRGRHDLPARDEERLVHTARLVCGRRRARARHLSLRDHEPDLRHRRRRSDSQRRGREVLRRVDRARGGRGVGARRLERREGEGRSA